jgi:hypothetical protein
LLLLCEGCSGGSAGALHVRLNAGPAAAPFDTPVHITASAQDTQFYLGTTGFTVRLQVLAGGSVQAAATLVRRWSFATGPTAATVAHDGLAGTLYTPDRVRPGAPAVVVIGGSEGAEGALLIASYEPHLFDTVIANSPSSMINGAFGGFGAAWTFHGKPLPGAEIPVGNIRVPLLLGDGGQDAVWDSAGSATEIVQELRGSGDRAPYTNLYYPGAGHAYTGTPPYVPYSGYGSRGNTEGGSEQANALAAEQFWAKMITFINGV